MGDVVALDKNRKAPKDPDPRQMPSNGVVEAALLYALMSPGMSTPELHATLRLLTPDHFFVPQNARVFAAMQALAHAKATIEPVSVYARIKDTPAPMGGWMVYLTETIPIEGAQGEAPPGEYAKIILDRWRAREVIKVCSRVMDRAFGGAESTTLLDDLRASSGAIADTYFESTGATARDALAEAWSNIITKNQPGVRGMSWGWPSVDAAFGRMRPERMSVLAAVPGVGKTNLAWHIAEAVALSEEDEHGVGEAVYFVSAELKAHELVGRQAGIRASVAPEATEGDRELTQDEIGRLTEAQRDIELMPIVVDDNGGRAFTVADIEARVRSAQIRFAAGTYATRDGLMFPKNRLRFVVVDYLTKLKPPALPYGQRYDSREREVAAISAALMEMAKVLNVHVLVIAAVSRGEKSKGTDPKKRELQMSDLRESGMIEYDAAAIVFANVPEDGVIRLKNAKQRFRDGAPPVELAMARGRIFEGQR